MTDAAATVQVHLSNKDTADRLAADASRGLMSVPKDLPPRWFYDKRGSQLFEAITSLEEYYPTRCEREVLRERSEDIAACGGFAAMVELGSGSSAKSRLLLDALVDRGLQRYVPFDVSEETLREACTAIAREYKSLEVTGLVGDFDQHLHLIPRRGRQLVAFLGSTIGNFAPEPRAKLLREIRSIMEPTDMLLLGADLVKDEQRLLRAYDDSRGVTAEFNLNVLQVLNEQLCGDFEPRDFEHVARWDQQQEWIEMRLRSRRAQVVHLDVLDLDVEFAPGEEMRTEISAKFRRPRLELELESAGMELRHWWTDPAGDFSLSCWEAV